MPSYIVIVDNAENVPEVGKMLDRHYPDNYQHPGVVQVFFVRDNYAVSEKIARTLGMFREENSTQAIPGTVFKLNASYFGLSRPAIWEWLGKSDGSARKG